MNLEPVLWEYLPPWWTRESRFRLDDPNGTIKVSQISSMSDAHTPAFALQHTLLIPAQVSTLMYTQNGMLTLGSGELSSALVSRTRMHCLPSKDDGSLRLYCPPDTKVVRAIRGLDSEVSSVISVTPNNGDLGHIWAACGSSVSVDAFSSLTPRGCI
jgi:hypothetical protein